MRGVCMRRWRGCSWSRGCGNWGEAHTKALSLKTEMAEGESAAVIGPTRHPASRVASSYRCNRCEPESLVEPSTTPSSSLSIPVSRLRHEGVGAAKAWMAAVGVSCGAVAGGFWG